MQLPQVSGDVWVKAGFLVSEDPAFLCLKGMRGLSPEASRVDVCT